jgi:hypothetical protein
VVRGPSSATAASGGTNESASNAISSLNSSGNRAWGTTWTAKISWRASANFTNEGLNRAEVDHPDAAVALVDQYVSGHVTRSGQEAGVVLSLGLEPGSHRGDIVILPDLDSRADRESVPSSASPIGLLKPRKWVLSTPFSARRMTSSPAC